MTRKTISTIAQIIIVVLILPLLCWLIKILFPEQAADFLWNLLGTIEIIDNFSDIIKEIVINYNSGSQMTIDDIEKYFNIINLQKNIFQSMFLGLCAHILNKITELINLKGVIAILEAVAGVFFGCFFWAILEIGSDPMYEIMSVVFLLVLCVVLEIITFPLVFAGPNLVQSILLRGSVACLEIGGYTFVAIFAGMYVMSLFLFINGYISDVFVLAWVVIPIIMLLAGSLLMCELIASTKKAVKKVI